MTDGRKLVEQIDYIVRRGSRRMGVVQEAERGGGTTTWSMEDLVKSLGVGLVLSVAVLRSQRTYIHT